METTSLGISKTLAILCSLSLDRAVSDIKSGRLPRSQDIDKKTLETSIDFAALIPETYLLTRMQGWCSIKG